MGMLWNSIRRKAVDRRERWVVEGGIGWAGRDRKDLLDYVIAKGADVIVWFIQNVGEAERACTCCAL